MSVLEQAQAAKVCARTLMQSSEATRNRALACIATALLAHTDAILAANKSDIQRASAAGQRESFIDRLTLTAGRIAEMAEGMRQVATLPDPLGVVAAGKTLSSGIQMTRVKVPFGVIAMIYEARPNVTADAAALCLKSGNAAVLRGSKEALASNKAIADAITEGLLAAGLPKGCVQLIEDTTRESATELMTLRGVIDLLIPRGGAGLIRSVVDNARVPVIETGVGNCHVFVDESADLEMAISIVDNAKTSRPSVCNTMETLLVHKSIAKALLPALAERLKSHHVEWRGCEVTRQLVPAALPVTEVDYQTEFGDYIMAVRVVESLTAAVEHIMQYSSGHSECIVTNDYQNAQRFTKEVDAAAVYVNASTRFTDGGLFGLGAEIGISTQKMHVRGPMGLSELTTDKYILLGSGQIRE